MMKKKRLTLILTVLLFALPSMTWAQTIKQQLVVWQKNGDKVRYDLAELPETSFENGLWMRSCWNCLASPTLTSSLSTTVTVRFSFTHCDRLREVCTENTTNPNSTSTIAVLIHKVTNCTPCRRPVFSCRLFM